MRNWDLTGGAARLSMAMKNLHKAVDQTSEHWDDVARQRFDRTYLEPLEPKMREVLEAVKRLEQVLLEADHACGTR
jgi:hypothetical protein